MAFGDDPEEEPRKSPLPDENPQRSLPKRNSKPPPRLEFNEKGDVQVKKRARMDADLDKVEDDATMLPYRKQPMPINDVRYET